MFRRDHLAWSRVLKASAAVVLCALLMGSAKLTEHAVVYAQANAPGWTGPTDISHPLSAGRDLNGVLLCDPYQNLHIFWGKGQADGSEIYYRTDKEGSLSAPTDVLATFDSLAVNLSVALTEQDNFIHLVWADQYTQGTIYYSRAPLADAQDPRAWDTPRVLIAPAESAGIRVDGSGTLYLTAARFEADGYATVAYQMRSTDSGATWSEPVLIYERTLAEPTFLLVTAAFDEGGRLHVGIIHRSQQYGADSEVGYMRSLDTGQTWEPYRVIAVQSEATPNVSNIAPFAFGEDEIHLTWHDPRRMHAWSNDGGVTWSNPVEIIKLGAGFGGANQLVKDSAGVLRAVTSVNAGVYVSTFDGSGWRAHERIENRDLDPHGQQIEICQGNELHVLYDDRLVEETTVWYAHRVVNAPHIERGPIPMGRRHASDVSTTEVGREATATAEPTITPPPALPPRDVVPPATSGGELLPLLIGTIPVIALTIVAILSRKHRGR